MNILICDDMPEEAKELDELLHNSGFSVNTAIFRNGCDALEFFRTGAVVDVCILDIIMPETNGVQLAQELRKNGFGGEIVFLSVSRDYGPESYRVKAFDYLLKPLTVQAVQDILDRLEKARQNSDSEGLLVKATGISRFILFHEISYVEVIAHAVYYRLTDGGEVRERTTFTEVVPKLLKDSRFVRCHRSFIVNMDDIKSVSAKEFTMRNGTSIPLSKNYPEAKKRYLQRVAFGGQGK